MKLQPLKAGQIRNCSDGGGIDDFFVNYKTLVLLSSRDITVIGTFALPESTHMVHIMDAPDLDGDGMGEILMGSTRYDAGEAENAGGIFIVSSRLLTS